MQTGRPEELVVKIEVTAHGPYEVSGDVPLRPRSPVESEFGEPLTWRTEDPVDHPPTYELCRCGQSSNKPFCDGTHAFVRFDGTEAAPVEPSSDRAERFERTGITVVNDELLCVHAGFCGNRLTNWYEMLSEMDDSVTRSHLIGMLEHCPSGALAVELGGESIEPDHPAQISPVPDGPLWVTGGITILRADGEPFEARNRVTLCRCGASSTKPLCDGTHKSIGFKT